MSIDDERLQLERRLRELNARTGLSLDDAEYLKEYLDICERAMQVAGKDEYSYEEKNEKSAFTSELAVLNERYKTRVSAGVFKNHLIAFAALERGYEVGCWSSSTSGCNAATDNFVGGSKRGQKRDW